MLETTKKTWYSLRLGPSSMKILGKITPVISGYFLLKSLNKAKMIIDGISDLACMFAKLL